MTDAKKPSSPGTGNGNCPPGGTTPCPETPAEETVTLKLITPGGDPVNSPNSNQGADGQNEFTYSIANPGVLTIKLKAKVEPSGKASSIRDRVLFEVDAIGISTMAWDAANPGGKPTVNGDFLEAVVTFTGLPKNNTDFGLKKARLKLDGSVNQSNNYEVFFPRDAKNHPDGDANSPNWYHYWGQVLGRPNMVYGGASGTSLMAEVRGMTQWNYTTAPDKIRLFILDEVVAKARAYGVGVEVSGIDNFAGTVVHESKHIDQIARADPLVPGSQCWRHGYSWNQSPHNHWSPGPDGKWGTAPGVATVSVNVSPPFQAGAGDDVDIDIAAWRHWPNSWTMPAPSWTPVHPIEDEAIMQADAAVPNDHLHADKDWGDPGKNHKTLLKFDD